MKCFLTWLLLIATCLPAGAQEAATSPLYKTLAQKDSLLFEVGFNTCNLAVTDSLVAADFEFYHDQSGITATKADFLSSIKNGLCNLPYKAIRKLVPGSLTVFPLYKNGECYGAIQNGLHQFFADEPSKPRYFTSAARFTHVWLLINGQWQLSRVLSYDHQTKPVAKPRKHKKQ